MAGINFLGSYSGFDQSTIDSLMQVEKMPLVQLADKKTNITAQQNAWKDVNTRLNSLFEKLKTLQSSETFTSKTSKSSNEGIVTMSASKNAVAGTYKINVEQLATNTSIIAKEIELPLDDITGETSLTKALEIEGEFTIINADPISPNFTEAEKDAYKKACTVEVESGDSLRDVVSKINEKNKTTGVSATIINNRIVLTDNKTGARKISLDGYGNGTLTELGLNYEVATATMGKNALFSVNGVDVERATNTVSDAVEGVTINLNKTHAKDSDPKIVYDTITVSQDTSKLTTAIQDFVDQYNSTMTFIEDKLAAGTPEVTSSRGTLAGDSGLQRLHSSLRNMVTSSVKEGNSTIKDISQLGVTTIDKFGQLQFNSSELTKALAEDPQKVMDFFSSKVGDKEVGFAPRLKDYVDSFISKSDGVIKGKTESFDRTLKDLNKQIERFNTRMERKEAYYTKMFAALDVAMMQSESQMSWLEGQVSAMNAQKK